MKDSEIIQHLKTNRFYKASGGLYAMLPPVKKYILANNGTGEDAKDIFQDALVILYKKIKANELTLSVPLKTYLFAVSKNCWLQELRKRKNLAITDSDHDLPEIVIDDEAGFSTAEAAFGLLGEKCRQLLILFYFKKKTYTEIAVALSFRSEHVAKNQKYRCIQKAKENYSSIIKTAGHES